MKFEHTEVFNVLGALRGMRNPKNSWHKNDSHYDNLLTGRYIIGENDLDLARRLINAGPEHRKFLRQIIVSVDITAPRYWWSEFDTYKIGTVSNSCSTMHKLDEHDLTLCDFEISKDEDEFVKETISIACTRLNKLRAKYLETKDFKYIRMMKKILPESFLQKRTILTNFEVLYTQYKQRKSHRLPEWREDFINWLSNIDVFDKLILAK